MAWLATGEGLDPASLLARVAVDIPDHSNVQSGSEAWGSWIVAEAASRREPSWHRRKRWLLAGRPTKSPWGCGLQRVDFGAVVEALERFGPAATTMYAGPLVVIDLSSGFWYSSLNGILSPGVLACDPRIQSLSAPLRRPPAEGRPIGDLSPAFSYRGLVRELQSFVGEVGDRFALDDPTKPALELGGTDCSNEVFETRHGALLAWPKNLEQILTQPRLLGRARDEVVPELAWRADRLGRDLLAPFLERVVLDQVGFGYSGSCR